MKVETRELKNVSVVKVSGRVDSLTAPELDTVLKDHLSADRNNVVVDLQETEYMSSAGLRALVAALKEAKRRGGNVRLAQPSTRVQEVIDLAGLTPVFDIHPDVVEAVGAF
jgi:anti-sigma B factor antagonist